MTALLGGHFYYDVRMRIAFRRACQSDLAKLMQMFAYGQKRLAAIGVHQWEEGVYPNAQIVADDIAASICYVAQTGGEVVATMSIDPKSDPCFARADLAWRYPPEQAVVLHRLAVCESAQGRGVAREFLRFASALAGRKHLRVDTSPQNLPMVNLLLSEGYERVGTLVYEDYGNIRCDCFEK